MSAPKLAVIVRGADTGRSDLAPETAGLLAISRGLSLNFENDHDMLERGMVMYDALYAWCISETGGTQQAATLPRGE